MVHGLSELLVNRLHGSVPFQLDGNVATYTFALEAPLVSEEYLSLGFLY